MSGRSNGLSHGLLDTEAGREASLLSEADGLEEGLRHSRSSRAPASWRVILFSAASLCLLGWACLLYLDQDQEPDGEILVSAKIELFQTAKDTGDRLSSLPELSLEEDYRFYGTLIHINPSIRDQAILGFGGAFTEAAALQFKGLNPELRRKVIEMYFGDSGLRYSTGRVPINSCDFSPESYNFDDVAGDVNLAHFDHEVEHDQAAIIPFIKAAQTKTRESGRPWHLFASPWSAPGWMKSNGQMLGSPKIGLRPEFRATWAEYLSLWISAYKAQDIPIWAITVQNEPEYNAPWEAMKFTSGEEANFIGHYLGPVLRANHPEVKILGYDHGKPHLDQWANALYHSDAQKYLTGIAFHWYEGDHFDNVRKVHQSFPQALLLPTEATWEFNKSSVRKESSSWKTGTWSFGEGYAHDIMGDLKAGAAGWTDWNLLLNTSGGPNHQGNTCDAPIFVDVGKQKLHVHPQFYYIGHFSKFILPGSVRISSQVGATRRYHGPSRDYGTCNAEDGLDVVSFQRPDNKIATVVLNCADRTVEFKITFQWSSRVMRGSIPPHAIQTYLFQIIGKE